MPRRQKAMSQTTKQSSSVLTFDCSVRPKVLARLRRDHRCKPQGPQMRESKSKTRGTIAKHEEIVRLTRCLEVTRRAEQFVGT